MDVEKLCEAALDKIQVIYLEAFPCPDGWIIGTNPPNKVPNTTSPEYVSAVEAIMSEGGDPERKVTFEFRPHAPVVLRQTTGQMTGKLTLKAMEEIHIAIRRMIAMEVILSLGTPAGTA